VRSAQLRLSFFVFSGKSRHNGDGRSARETHAKDKDSGRIAVQSQHGTLLTVVLAILSSQSAGEQQPLPRPPANRAPATALERLLQHPEVQKELKLSRTQQNEIKEITRRVREQHQEELERLGALSPEEQRRKQAELDNALTKEIMNVLSSVLESKQLARLKEIQLQQQGLRAFSDSRVEGGLRLTDAQKASLKIIQEDAAKEIRSHFSVGTKSTFVEAMKKVEVVRRTALERCVGLLSEEQKQAWRKMVGQPFQLQAEPPLIQPPVGQPGKPVDRQP
jgi:hypothetical protein